MAKSTCASQRYSFSFHDILGAAAVINGRNLREEQEQREDAHDVHVDAVDLHDPQARDVAVLDGLGLVVLFCAANGMAVRMQNTQGSKTATQKG